VSRTTTQDYCGSGVLPVVLAREIDIVSRLCKPAVWLSAASADTERALVVDLPKVTFRGRGVALLQLRSEARPLGFAPVSAAGSPAVLRLLEVLTLHGLFRMADTSVLQAVALALGVTPAPGHPEPTSIAAASGPARIPAPRCGRDASRPAW
jgi:anti-anti-sigma regulatory factor